ncbi:MAG: hypothetical protein WA144_00920 [Candidatus Methanoperedens sp.]
MTLLVFLVILFGLFGMIATQYINQYRIAYQLWTKEKIFNITINNENDKIDFCSKIESYSRELCEINDLLGIVLFMLYATLTIIIGTTYVIFQITDFHLKTFFTNLSVDSIKIFASLLLTIMVFLAIPIICHYLKINMWNPSQSSSIDKMLFDLWWKNKCHRHKDKEGKKNMQPLRLYELLDENIKNGKITDYTEDEKELVKNLTKTKEINNNP